MTTCTLINLTPHTVHVDLDGAIARTSLQSAGIARLTEQTTDQIELSFDPCGDGGFYVRAPLVRRGFSAVDGLPAPRSGIMYIVSQLVIDACPHRDDLITPYPVVRDAQGVIVGCTGFARRLRG